MSTPLSTQLLDWYGENARQLPWRDRPEPYRVWISEVMLQQTRVETVIPYFERWMERFPDIPTLAAAPLDSILALWEGLGYYSRARNLHRSAHILITRYDGKLPQNPQELRRLPGIGRYTAAAIASIAFNLDEPALDGNIRRVLARLFDLRLPARSPEGESRLWELAAEHLPPGQAGDYNQALMDLGATLCKPRQPDCANCPLMELCAAYELGVQEQRPVKEKKPAIPHYAVAAAVIHNNGNVLIAQRPPRGLLGGLWEFPGGKLEPGEDLPAALRREIREELGVEIDIGGSIGIYRHAYTHFRVTLHAFRCCLLDEEPRPLEHQAIQWTTAAELSGFPMGKLDRQIANTLTC